MLLFTGTAELDAERLELLTARGVGVVTGSIRAFSIEQDRVTGVDLEDGSHVPRTALFVRPGFAPNHDLLLELGCHIDDTGWICHDATGRTTTDGVWVADNAANPRAQVITAAGGVVDGVNDDDARGGLDGERRGHERC